MRDSGNYSLITRCINGDREAWDSFVVRFSPLILWSIKQKLCQVNLRYNQQDIQDIFQNVFVLLWEKGKLTQIRNRDKISSWLVMVAANCTLNYFRSKKEALDYNQNLCNEVAVHDCNITGNLDQQHLRIILDRTLGSLTVREQIIFKLHYLFGKTHCEIGKIMRMPGNSISSIIKRAREKLKEELKKQGW